MTLFITRKNSIDRRNAGLTRKSCGECFVESLAVTFVNDILKLHAVVDGIAINHRCKNVKEARIGAQRMPFSIYSSNRHRCRIEEAREPHFGRTQCCR